MKLIAEFDVYHGAGEWYPVAWEGGLDALLADPPPGEDRPLLSEDDVAKLREWFAAARPGDRLYLKWCLFWAVPDDARVTKFDPPARLIAGPVPGV